MLFSPTFSLLPSLSSGYSLFWPCLRSASLFFSSCSSDLVLSVLPLSPSCSCSFSSFYCLWLHSSLLVLVLSAFRQSCPLSSPLIPTCSFCPASPPASLTLFRPFGSVSLVLSLLFMLRLSLASPDLPALSGHSQLAFSLFTPLFHPHSLFPGFTIFWSCLRFASLYASLVLSCPFGLLSLFSSSFCYRLFLASPDLPALSGHSQPTFSLSNPTLSLSLIFC